jgi:hypothetical protein
VTDNAERSQGNDERDARIYHLKTVQCWSELKIAMQEGISQQRVSQIVAEQRAAMPPVDLEAIREAALRLHEDVIARAYELAGMKGAPVFVGKDGDVAYDPEDGAVVRDFGTRMAALKLALHADGERRKLMGLDAATKTEVSGTVRYEIAGVDVEAMK